MKYLYAMLAALFLASCTATQTPIDDTVEVPAAADTTITEDETKVVEEVMKDMEVQSEEVNTPESELPNPDAETETKEIPAVDLTPSTEVKTEETKEDYKADSETKAS